MLSHLEIDGGNGAASCLEAVLIVEDEGLLSMTMEDQVREFGARRVFICRDGGEAIRIAREEPLDCAVLDVSVRGGSTYEVADALADRNIPFLFCTGVATADLAERHRSRPLLAKPYGDSDFRAALKQALRR
jgi:CheY-like chemotaxis protein